MATSKTVTIPFTTIYSGDPWRNYSSLSYAWAANYEGFGDRVIIAQASIGTLPDSFTVSNARFELDQYSGGSGSGSGQIKHLRRGFVRTEANWYMRKTSPNTSWVTGGPFVISSDLDTLYWSGTFTNSTQECYGNSNLAADIEAKRDSGWIAIGIIGVDGGLKAIDGLSLKFDYTETGTPAVTGFSPDGMDVGDTPTLYVYGTDFDAGTLDSIQLIGSSNYSLTSISADSSTQVHGTVPSGVVVGEYTVRVTIDSTSYDGSATFSVASSTPTITDVYGDDGGSMFVHNRRRTVTIEGTYLGGTSAITLLGQEGQGNASLTVTYTSPTKVSGYLTGPIPPGSYKAKVECTEGTVYSNSFQVSLGPAWW